MKFVRLTVNIFSSFDASSWQFVLFSGTKMFLRLCQHLFPQHICSSAQVNVQITMKKKEKEDDGR